MRISLRINYERHQYNIFTPSLPRFQESNHSSEAAFSCGEITVRLFDDDSLPPPLCFRLQPPSHRNSQKLTARNQGISTTLLIFTMEYLLVRPFQLLSPRCK